MSADDFAAPGAARRAIGKLDPGGGVIARLFPTPGLAIDTGADAGIVAAAVTVSGGAGLTTTRLNFPTYRYVANPANAIALSSAAYPVWRGTVTLPTGRAVAYKYIKKEGSTVIWEGDPNRARTTPATNPCTATWDDTWR